MRKLLFITLVLLSQMAIAGGQVGTVHVVLVRASDGLVYFEINGAPKTGAPSCATASYWMIRDENSNTGKQQYAMLLAAQASGKTIQVSGLNTCIRWSDGEDVNWIQMVE